MEINFLSYVLSIMCSYFSVGYFRDLYTFYLYSFKHFLYKLCLFFFFHYNIKSLILIDIVCADFPHNRHRFFFFYNFFSITYNIRLILSFFVDQNDSVLSIIRIFPVANWMEREVYDMFGVIFINHPDLRRILTDYGFFGHPLKKDYPLSGFIEVHYDDSYKCIFSNSVNLIQDYRQYNFDLPWV